MVTRPGPGRAVFQLKVLLEEDQARCRRLGISALLFMQVSPPDMHGKVQVTLAARVRYDYPSGPRRPPPNLPQVSPAKPVFESAARTLAAGYRTFPRARSVRAS